jgi:hypothetical protein
MTFLKEAHDFFDSEPVRVYQLGVDYGRGEVIVSVVQLKRTPAVHFYQDGAAWDVVVFPSDSPNRTFYEIGEYALRTSVQYASGTTSELFFTRH